MKVGRIKKTEERVNLGYLSSLDIKMFGRNNLYPQELHDIVFASSAARRCFERKALYIEGNGITSAALSEAVCNNAGEMVDDIHAYVSRDLALFDGFALHVNYNILGEITSVAHIPFENCRLEEDDIAGNVAHIVIHPDWTGIRKTRGGKQLRVTRESVKYFPVFNPDPAVVQSQIVAAGGIDLYNGQVLYVTLSGRNRYSVPEHDATVTDMSTDEGISNVSYRNARNAFLPAAIMVMKKGMQYPDAVEGEDPVQHRINETGQGSKFFQVVEQMQGDTHACKIITLEIERDDEKPEIISVPMANYDKQFEATREAVVENIYAAFGQEQFYRLRSGSLGFSGEIANDAKSEYCEQVTRYQRLQSRYYRTIFEHWSKSEPIPYAGADDVAIEPLLKSVNPTGQMEGGV